MKKPFFWIAQLLAVCTLALSFTSCEYLFYSPAFMPAVSETELQVLSSGEFEESYNGEQSAYGTWAFADPALSFLLSGTTDRAVPAMDSLAVGNESWHGVSEFLAMFFSGSVSVYSQAPVTLGGSFHAIAVSFDFESYSAAEYNLPFVAVKGINENGATKTINGNLGIAEVRCYSTNEELSGDGTFVFGNGPSDYGLLYLVFYHDSGMTTVAYQHESSISAGSYFPEGHFTYIINVFPD